MFSTRTSTSFGSIPAARPSGRCCPPARRCPPRAPTTRRAPSPPRCRAGDAAERLVEDAGSSGPGRSPGHGTAPNERLPSASSSLRSHRQSAALPLRCTRRPPRRPCGGRRRRLPRGRGAPAAGPPPACRASRPSLWLACVSRSTAALIAAASSPSAALRASATASSIAFTSASASLPAVVGEQLLDAVGEGVGLVAQVDQLALLLVLGRRAPAASFTIFSTSSLARPEEAVIVMACALPVARVLGRDVQDAVGVDVERDLDLRHAARRRRDADQVELAERAVVRAPSRARPAARGSRPRSGCRRRSRRPRVFLVGIVVLRSMSWVITPPRVSTPATAA